MSQDVTPLTTALQPFTIYGSSESLRAIAGGNPAGHPVVVTIDPTLLRDRNAVIAVLQAIIRHIITSPYPPLNGGHE